MGSHWSDGSRKEGRKEEGGRRNVVRGGITKKRMKRKEEILCGNSNFYLPSDRQLGESKSRLDLDLLSEGSKFAFIGQSIGNCFT